MATSSKRSTAPLVSPTVVPVVLSIGSATAVEENKSTGLFDGDRAVVVLDGRKGIVLKAFTVVVVATKVARTEVENLISILSCCTVDSVK